MISWVKMFKDICGCFLLKLAMLDRTGQTVKKHVDVVSRLTIVPLLTELVLVVARTDTQEIHVMVRYSLKKEAVSY